MRRCVFIPHYDMCADAVSPIYQQVLFLTWEIQSEAFDAALKRFRECDWKSLRGLLVFRVVREFSAKGHLFDIPDILAEAQKQVDGMREPPARGDVIPVRGLIAAGEPRKAVETVLNRSHPSDRVHGLAVIAEALAQLPAWDDCPRC